MADGLNITDLHIERAGAIAVRSVSLSAPTGSITALLGPNGAGKSSLVLACGGVIPFQGSIEVGGTDLSRSSPEQIRGNGLAIVPEGHRLLTTMTARENLDVAAANHRRATIDQRRERVLEVIPELGALLDRPAGALSGGEQQMVSVGQALMSDPSVLVVDEMSLGLAPLIVDRLLRLLERLADQGVAVLLIEQFVSKALAIAEDVFIMSGGVISHHGPASELKDDPELLAAAYLGAEAKEA